MVRVSGLKGDITYSILSRSNQWIVDLDNLQNYLDIIVKKELEADDFLTLDLLLNSVGASNSVVNVIPALRNSNMSNTNTANGPPNPASINSREPAYFQVGGLGNTLGAGNAYNVQFPLRLIKNTAFSIDKDLYLGQTSYLKLYFGPISKVC